MFSHWLLDLPMHTADLPLFLDPSSPKVGGGLWNHVAASLAAELLVLGAGAAIYLKATQPKNRASGVRTGVFGAVLLGVALATPFMPIPASDRAFAAQALGLYAALAVFAQWVDRGREPRVSRVVDAIEGEAAVY